MLLTFASKSFTSSAISFWIVSSSKSLTNDITKVKFFKCTSTKLQKSKVCQKYKYKIQNYNNLEILNKEFVFLNSVQSSSQPVREAIACWKSGQPSQCANYIFAPSLAALHVLSQHSSLCSRYFCSLRHSLTYMRLA